MIAAAGAYRYDCGSRRVPAKMPAAEGRTNMAEKITVYQCPACTGPLKFDGNIGKLKCEYCGSTYTTQEIEALYADKNKSAAAADAEAHKKAAAAEAAAAAASAAAGGASGTAGGSDAASGSYQYLTGALTSVYGQNTDTDPLEIVSAMDRIYPGYYTADRLSQVYGWRSGDGTAIYLYYYADSSFAILYVSPDIVSSGTGNYVTTGL